MFQPGKAQDPTTEKLRAYKNPPPQKKFSLEPSLQKPGGPVTTHTPGFTFSHRTQAERLAFPAQGGCPLALFKVCAKPTRRSPATRHPFEMDHANPPPTGSRRLSAGTSRSRLGTSGLPTGVLAHCRLAIPADRFIFLLLTYIAICMIRECRTRTPTP